MKAVILAGGRGTRLAPYTSILPKPLMPIGDRAILEIVLDQLGGAGFTRAVLCVGYLSHLIQAVLENRPGNSTGPAITYVHENEPRGTAGPLRLVDGLDSTFLAMNGDVLTTLDYADLLQHHRVAGNAVTIACHRRVTTIDYGILHLTGEAGVQRVHAYEEKPEIPLIVSMGVYVLEPDVLRFIPEAGPYDFPQLVQALLASGLPVGAYLFDGFWLDIGRHEDYEQAIEVWEHEQRAAQGTLTASL